MSAKKKTYSDAEKAAYYKAKYAAASKSKSKYRKAPASYEKKYYKKKYDTKPRKRQDPGAISAIGSTLGTMAGTYFGGPLGGGVGTFLGGKLGHLIESITGFGDYSIGQNSVMKGGLTPPQVVNSVNKGSIIVRHREYIGDINATSAFTLTSYPINPGQSRTFPWLSGIAVNFEQYRMRGCLFEFLSTSSDSILASSSSSALGTVNMATEYDSLENNFSGKREMLNHEFANSRKPSVSFIHPIECKRSLTPVSELYVRPHSVPSNADQRLYDLGKFQIATEGMQAATGVVGELWVTYEVELFKAKYDVSQLSAGLSDHFVLTGVTNSLPLGTGSAPSSTSSLGGTINTITRAYSFPNWISEGRWLICWYVVGTANVVATPTLTYTNCTMVNLFHNGTNGYVGTSAPANTTTITTLCCVDVTGAGASIQWSTGTLPSSVTAGDIVVTQLSYGLTVPQIVTKKSLKQFVSESTPQPQVELLDEGSESESEEVDHTEYIKFLESEVKKLRLERKDSKTTLTPTPLNNMTPTPQPPL